MVASADPACVPFSSNRLALKCTIVFFGGSDCYIEEAELPRLSSVFASAGYDVIAFDGPGQGGRTQLAGLSMSADWRRPVSAVLDFFEVERAAVVNAQALRNQTVPLAESSSLANQNSARAQGAGAVARATGEAWSFLTLQEQYRASPQDYVFRRRLETLEKTLAGRRFTIVDSRFQRDGGELWVMP